MTWEAALLVYGLMLFATLLGGVAIGAAMGLVGIVAVTAMSGTSLWITFGDVLWNTSNSFTLVAVPLFVLMGEIILRSGMSQRFYAAVARLLRRVPGGLAQTNIVGCAIFAAVSGSSTATAMTIGTVALPEMRKRGYADTLTLGTLCGGGCLGILIPPSIPMLIYAATVQESVIALFVAGIVPGLVLTGMFIAYITVRAVLQPELAPRGEMGPAAMGRGRALLDCLPIAGLILAVLGGMYFGITTPTEAAAVGAALALAMGMAYGDIDRAQLMRALRNAVLTSCVMMFIILNAQILSFAIVTLGIGRGVAGLFADAGLSPFVFFLMLVLLYLLMGMFVDGISMMLLTLPVLYPTILAMGFDGIWFGVVMMVLIELGQITPPMGLNLFAVQSISGGVAFGTVARSALPYVAIISALCFLLYFQPGLALWLPGTM